MNIILVGAYPPPTGGNSVHIKRLHEALHKKGIVCDVIDMYSGPSAEITPTSIYRIGPVGIKSISKCIALMRKKPYDVVHFHASSLKRFMYVAYLFMFFIPTNTRTVLTIHSGQFVETFCALSGLGKYLTTALLRRISHIITVNHKQKNLLENIGVIPEQISVIPAYIPPTPKPFQAGDEILARLKSDNRVVAISSGYGEPLYGYHRIFAALKSNPILNQKISLLLCMYNHFDKEYMAQISSLTREAESVEIVRNLDSEQFAYLLSRSDIYIRATDSDGDAVAIREAAQFGVAVIASDIGERPEYCHSFGLDDTAGLANQLLQCINTPKINAAITSPLESTADRICNVYSNKIGLKKT